MALWLGALALSLAAALVSLAHGRDLGQWAGQPQAVRDWYAQAELTPAAQQRFHFTSCCAHADVVRTKFRVGTAGEDAWEWLDGSTWRAVPADIIHWNEHAPDGQPTLFVLPGTSSPTCFYPPDGGI
jgi:hypothetical protein